MEMILKRKPTILFVTFVFLLSSIFAFTACNRNQATPSESDITSSGESQSSQIDSSDSGSSDSENSGSENSDTTSSDMSSGPSSGETGSDIESSNSESESEFVIIASPTPATTPTKAPGATATPTATATGQPAYDPYASIPANLKGTTVRVLLWYTPTQDGIKVYDNFTVKTGIKVRYVVTTYDAYQTRLAAMVAARDGLDAVMMYAPFYPTFITRNLLQPIEPYIDKKDTFWDYNMMNQFKWGSDYYGVSSKDGSDMGIIIYNKTMFDNAGRTTPRQLWNNGNWNWDTFLDAAKAMTRKVGGVDIWGFNTPKNANWMLSTGQDFVRYQNNPDKPIVHNLTNANVLKGWQFMVDLRNVHNVDNAGQSVADFIAGKVAMYGEQSWMMGSGPGNPLNSMTDEWDVVPWPSPKGQAAILPVTGKVWSIPIHSKNQLGGYYFLRYTLDTKNAVTQPLAKTHFQNVMNAMMDMPKSSDLTQGLMPGTDYWDLWAAIMWEPDINSTLNAWIPRVNSAIDAVVNEIPKQ